MRCQPYFYLIILLIALPEYFLSCLVQVLNEMKNLAEKNEKLYMDREAELKKNYENQINEINEMNQREENDQSNKSKSSSSSDESSSLDEDDFEDFVVTLKIKNPTQLYYYNTDANYIITQTNTALPIEILPI